MIDLQTEGVVWTVTINRPDKANSLTRAMLTDILDIALDANGKASVVVFTGIGKVFSAGADLTEVKSGLATDPVWEHLSAAICDLPCLTLAALNGTLAGGAFGMALACDLRITVETAKFFYPVMQLGVLPQPSDPGRLAALIGPARAKMILMAGQKIDAQTALTWGLVDQIATADGLTDVIKELSRGCENAAPDHIAGIKSLF